MRRQRAVLVVAVLAGVYLTALGQEKSVAPGINKSFENPDVTEFQGRFEKEGRDAFDHREQILAAMKLRAGMTVADIGTGTGLFTRMFARAVGPTGKVYAVDIAASFVKHVEESARKEGLHNVEGIVCKPDSVELPAGAIDLAYICDTYHHFEFPEKTMRSLRRALKPGGQVVLVDYRRIPGQSSEWTLSHIRAAQDVFEREIESCGFKKVEEKQDLLKESYFVRFEKVER
jgi:ubiquinone/menaquinone biosynthesis C-methylase UbiE